MGGLKALYRYAHPHYPISTFGMLVASPLEIDEMIGELVEVETQGQLVIHLELELDHFTLLTCDKDIVRELESTGVEFGFSPKQSLA